jgi:3-methyl-2-oxobutanoate hydroxymethyltransferase
MIRKDLSYINSKKGKDKIVCLTAYTYPIAQIIDEYLDIILVGDSLGMTIYGHQDTLNVTVDMMINHGKAVVNATRQSMIIVDMPYGSYENSKDQALENAKKILKETKCTSVKVEICPNIIEIVEYLNKNNVCVTAHIGLTPQHIEKFGGFKIQGRNDESAKVIYDLAIASQKAGASLMVIEGVIESLARKISSKLKIPTIGIGASLCCDGQILVIDDILGIKQKYCPRFVKNYENLPGYIELAAKNYSEDVKNLRFPEKKHCFF